MHNYNSSHILMFILFDTNNCICICTYNVSALCMSLKFSSFLQKTISDGYQSQLILKVPVLTSIGKEMVPQWHHFVEFLLAFFFFFFKDRTLDSF